MKTLSASLAALLLTLCSHTLAQSTAFKSSVDEQLTIQSVTLAPVIDNTNQIYAEPLTIQLRAFVEDSHKSWAIKPWPESSRITPEELEEKPDMVRAIASRVAADSILAARVMRGPGGMTLKLNLFSAADGKLLSQEIVRDYGKFEMTEVREEFIQMFRRMIERFPYRALVLSRRVDQVTLNVGSEQGFKVGDRLNVIQILKLNRHPRFQFIVSAESEILGRVVITKADQFLSFATVEMERELNTIQPLMKLLPLEFKRYSPVIVASGASINLSQRPESGAVFGEDPRAWVAQTAPSFGRVALMLGLGPYTLNNTLSISGGLEAKESVTPSLHVDAEMWLTEKFFGQLILRQYLASVSNPLAGSTPSSLSLNSLSTNLLLGYNLLIGGDFWGPKLQLLGGFSQFKSTVDSSKPLALSSNEFSGLAFGLGMILPISQEKPVQLGARILFYLNPSLSESPATTGSSSSARMAQFGLNLGYRMTQRMALRTDLNYELYSASFSGAGTRTESGSSLSHTITTVTGGVEYYF
jgi:hypothetical protein